MSFIAIDNSLVFSYDNWCMNVVICYNGSCTLGYARVSTDEQHTENQYEQLNVTGSRVRSTLRRSAQRRRSLLGLEATQREVPHSCGIWKKRSALFPLTSSLALYTALNTTPATTANMAQSVRACVKPRIGSPLSEPRKLQTRPAAELLSTSSGQERRRMR
jgi:hypothetical protein